MSYRNSYQMEVRHSGLNKYRLVKGPDKYVVEQKAKAQLAVWNEQWQNHVERKNKVLEKQKRISDKKSKMEEAAQRTEDAKAEIENLENLLKQSLTVKNNFDWETLRDISPFSESQPHQKRPVEVPPEPTLNDLKYKPNFNLLDNLISKRRIQKEEAIKKSFEKDFEDWKRNKESVDEINKKFVQDYHDECMQWEFRKQEYIKAQLQKNSSLDKRIKDYVDKNPEAIVDYFENVLSASNYPDYFPQEFELDFNPNNKVLIVSYSLPSLENIPSLKEVKYVQSKDDFTESYLSDSAYRQLYDEIIYQVALRTIHELFDADSSEILEMIVFNGWVESMDTAKGKKVNACIVSVQANKKEFSEINLQNVEPKACFKSLKGVGSSKLSSLTPIAPIIDISREDKRFISAYEVADELNSSTNLASMDWEDFEQLVREIFEKEFSQNGGEVKITQASRDGGVDAVAFDPDPIRGGKIVIQAKRYTNTVGVSAVRDLYGTVMNEGATKGILVTTADYGPDSYEFAKGKPLTLLNGSNLLSLLEKYGKKAKIDIRAAKKELGER